jgi:predicted nuclease with TOPRIM domain
MKQHKNLLKQTGETLSQNETLLESFTGKQTEANKAGADAVTTLKAQIAALNTKLQLNDQEIKDLDSKSDQLNDLKKATDKLRDAESAAEARSRDPRQGGYFGGETPEEAAEAAAKEAAGSQSRQDIATELDMLKLQQQGRSKIAEELGKEVELRKEAKALAENTNRSEEEMLATLREINAQKKDIADAGRTPAEARAARTKDRADARARHARDSRIKNRLDRPQIPRTNEEKKRAKEREEGKAVRDEQDRRNKAADLGKADEEAKKGWGKLISTQDKLAAFLEELSKI